MSSGCTSIRGLLHDYLEGEVQGPAANHVHQHLESCPACRRQAHAWLEDLHTLLGASSPPQHRVAANVLHRLRWHASGASPRIPTWIQVLVALACLLSLLLSALLYTLVEEAENGLSGACEIAGEATLVIRNRIRIHLGAASLVRRADPEAEDLSYLSGSARIDFLDPAGGSLRLPHGCLLHGPAGARITLRSQPDPTRPPGDRATTRYEIEIHAGTLLGSIAETSQRGARTLSSGETWSLCSAGLERLPSAEERP